MKCPLDVARNLTVVFRSFRYSVCSRKNATRIEHVEPTPHPTPVPRSQNPPGREARELAFALEISPVETKSLLGSGIKISPF